LGVSRPSLVRAAAGRALRRDSERGRGVRPLGIVAVPRGSRSRCLSRRADTSRQRFVRPPASSRAPEGGGDPERCADLSRESNARGAIDFECYLDDSGGPDAHGAGFRAGGGRAAGACAQDRGAPTEGGVGSPPSGGASMRSGAMPSRPKGSEGTRSPPSSEACSRQPLWGIALGGALFGHRTARPDHTKVRDARRARREPLTQALQDQGGQPCNPVLFSQ
jgi:hypothetical protein